MVDEDIIMRGFVTGSETRRTGQSFGITKSVPPYLDWDRVEGMFKDVE
jgi:hypothetical protein